MQYARIIPSNKEKIAEPIYAEANTNIKAIK
jgi:hypothetical protein